MTKAEPAEPDDALLTRLQHDAFQFFGRESVHLRNGLFPDSTQKDSPASIASIGFALSSYVVATERGFVSRSIALGIIRDALRFFAGCEQSISATATGYRGFYYHFLDRHTGRRTWKCELSSIDTALLVAGALVAAQYFDGTSADECEVRSLADEMYRRIEWDWMRGNGDEATVTMGWHPESGFLANRWIGFNEGLLLYILALGSPTHPIDAAGFDESVAAYRWHHLYGQNLAFAGPLFIHQMPHCYIDFRGIRDAYMRDHDSDYFENSRRATLVQRAYAIHNPRGFAGYGENCWGVTASDGPGPTHRKIVDREVEFFDYKARGAPFGPDDGSIAPWAAVASLPFAPEVVLPTIRHFLDLRIGETTDYGFEATFNPTFAVPDGDQRGWVSPYNFGLNQGPIVLMIENYRSGLIWRLLRDCPYVVTGLQRAGFSGGWLNQTTIGREGKKDSNE